MGNFSVQGCQQQDQYMKNGTRKGLNQMLENVGKEAGLGDLYFRNLYRFHGYDDQVSAADVVYGVTALLEASTTDAKIDWTVNFCTALEALSPDKWDHLRAGMQLAIKVQRACMSIGSAAIVKKRRNQDVQGLQQLSDAEIKSGQEELTLVLKLLMYCCMIRANRQALLRLGALAVVLEAARRAFSTDAVEPAEGLLLIVESLVSEANESDESRFRECSCMI